MTITTAIVSGSVPALRFGHIAPVSALRQQSRTTGSRGQGRVRSGLAAAQLALALTLLTGAGVLLASFYRLQHVDLGFHVDDVLTFEVNLPSARYDATRRAAWHEALAERLRTIPGVTAAGAISFLPATGSYHGWNTTIKSGPKAGTQVAKRDGQLRSLGLRRRRRLRGRYGECTSPKPDDSRRSVSPDQRRKRNRA